VELCTGVACVSALECGLASGVMCFGGVLAVGAVCGACVLVLRCGLASGEVCGVCVLVLTRE
jgi:hypothetical protein